MAWALIAGPGNFCRVQPKKKKKRENPLLEVALYYSFAANGFQVAFSRGEILPGLGILDPRKGLNYPNTAASFMV